MGRISLEKCVTAPGHPETERVGNITDMQIQKVGCGVVRFDQCQALRAKKRVRLLPSEDREQEGQVRVVGVQQIQLAKVQN
jgi:hypothetical protein